MEMAGGKQTDTGQLSGTELHQEEWVEMMAPVTKVEKDTWEDKVFHPALYEFVIAVWNRQVKMLSQIQTTEQSIYQWRDSHQHMLQSG